MTTKTISPATTGLYRRVWRWHFYAGLFCLPFVFTLALTGAIYLFHNQIDDLFYAPEMQRPQVSSATTVRPPAELIALALRQYPGVALAYGSPVDERHNAQVDVARADGTTLQVFINPATGAISGAIDEAMRAMTIVKRIHSLSIAGKAGQALIEIVAGWIIVLIATGFYLWWPRSRTVGICSIRPAARGRNWWRDLHAVTGLYGGIIILFLALTGMPWSVFWGKNVNAFVSQHGLGVPKGMWDGIPKSAEPLTAQNSLPWAQQQEAVPASSAQPEPQATHAQHAQHTQHAHHEHLPQPPLVDNAYAVLTHPGTVSPDKITSLLSSIGMTHNYRLSLPQTPSGVYTAIRMPGTLAGQRVVHIDQYNGKVLMDIDAKRLGAVSQVTEWGVSVHQGGEYGTPNLIIMLGGCLALMTLCISGITTWWKRRPSRKLAAPVRQDGDQLSVGVLIIAAVLGCIFPLLGASMLVALAIDNVIEKINAWKLAPT